MTGFKNDVAARGVSLVLSLAGQDKADATMVVMVRTARPGGGAERVQVVRRQREGCPEEEEDQAPGRSV